MSRKIQISELLFFLNENRNDLRRLDLIFRPRNILYRVYDRREASFDFN